MVIEQDSYGIIHNDEFIQRGLKQPVETSRCRNRAEGRPMLYAKELLMEQALVLAATCQQSVTNTCVLTKQSVSVRSVPGQETP
jgi:hypothetical protein